MMRQYAMCAAAAGMLLVGCGTASTTNGPAAEPPGAPGVTADGEGDGTSPDPAGPAPAKAEDEPAGPAGPLGSWENASCGDRGYRRQINFRDDGTFTAVDEVAPCPPQAKCVWSGIVHWRGNWSASGDEISLEVVPLENQRLPEHPPATFTVLSRDPYSIGEKSGDLVCPYREAR